MTSETGCKHFLNFCLHVIWQNSLGLLLVNIFGLCFKNLRVQLHTSRLFTQSKILKIVVPLQCCFLRSRDFFSAKCNRSSSWKRILWSEESISNLFLRSLCSCVLLLKMCHVVTLILATAANKQWCQCCAEPPAWEQPQPLALAFALKVQVTHFGDF